MVDFSFSCCGFFDVWRRRGLDGQRAQNQAHGSPFFRRLGAVKGAKLTPEAAAYGAPLTAPSRRKSHEHEIEGAAVGRALARLRRPRGFQRFISIASGCSNPSILGRAFLCDLVDSQNKLTFGRRVAGDCTLFPLSQGGELGRASPLFSCGTGPSNPSPVRPPGSTEVDRTPADS